MNSTQLKQISLRLNALAQTRNLEEAIDGSSDYGFRVIPHSSSYSLADSKSGIRIYSNPGREWSDDRFYVLDRRISKNPIKLLKKLDEVNEITGEEFLKRLECSIRSAYDKCASQYIGIGGGFSILLINRQKSIPKERLPLIAAGAEPQEWRGRGEDYTRPNKSEIGVLDQTVVGKKEQVTAWEGIVGTVYISKLSPELVVSMYQTIYDFESEKKTLSPSIYDIKPAPF